MSTEPIDVVIVGGSWAGLAAALQLGRARRRLLVVDAGEPRNRFAHESHGFLGQDGRAPLAIIETFRADVRAYPTVELRSDTVTDAQRTDEDGFYVDLGSGDRVTARRLILATGVVDELPEIPGLAERWGRTVLHCPYCHGYEVADRRLGILAIGELSMHQALLLPDWSHDVVLFTNGTFQPDSDQRTALARRGVRVEERGVAGVEGDTPGLTGVRLQDGELVPVDALFAAPRTRVAGSLAERLGCAFEDAPLGSFVRTDATKETSVRGVFCAGDAARAQHNATFATADGVMAGVATHRSLVELEDRG